MPHQNVLLLNDLKAGMVILLDEVVRIACVKEMTSIPVQSKNNDGVQIMQNRPAARVVMTQPNRPLKGYVTEGDAAFCNKLKEQLATDDDAETQDVQWEEVWTERAVPIWQMLHGKAAKQTAELEMQMYCRLVEGRDSIRNSSSPIANKPIRGRIIPAALVPGDLFFLNSDQRKEYTARIAADKRARSMDAMRIKEEDDMRKEIELRAQIQREEQIRAEVRAEVEAELRAKMAAVPVDVPAEEALAEVDIAIEPEVEPEAPESGTQTSEPAVEEPKPVDKTNDRWRATDAAIGRARKYGISLDDVPHAGEKITSPEVDAFVMKVQMA